MGGALRSLAMWTAIAAPLCAEPAIDPTGLPSDPAGWSYERWSAEPDRFPGSLEVITGKFAIHTPRYHAAAVRDLIGRVGAAEDVPARAALFRPALIASARAGIPFANESAAADSLGFRGNAAVTFRDGLRAWDAAEIGDAAEFLLRGIDADALGDFDRAAALATVAVYAREAGRVPMRTREGDGFVSWLTAGEVAPAIDRVVFGLSAATVAFGDRSPMRPLLYECLGDALLVRGRQPGEPDGLPERAYLRAAMLFDDSSIGEKYETLAAEAVRRSSAVPIEPTEARRIVVETRDQLVMEVAESLRWANELRESEEAWADAGLDPVEEYHARYASQILRVPRSRLRHRYTFEGIPMPLIAGTIALTALTVVGVGVVVVRKSRNEGVA